MDKVILKGYNAPNFFSDFPDGVISQEFYARIKDDPRAKTLRLVGGTLAEKYVITGKGYGIEGQKNNPTVTENYLPRMIEFCKNNGSGVVLVFRCRTDILQRSPRFYKQNMQLLQAFLDAGIKVHYIELGNELYFDNVLTGMPNGMGTNYGTLNASVDYYKTLFRLYRASVPGDIPISIVGDMPFHNRGRRWNSLIKSFDTEHISLHWYFDKVQTLEDMQKQVGRIAASWLPFNGKVFKINITEWNLHMGNNSKPELEYPNKALVDGPIHKMILENADRLFQEYGFNSSFLHSFASKENTPHATYRYAK